MKKIIFIFIVVFSFAACKKENKNVKVKKESETVKTEKLVSFGKKITADNFVSKDKILNTFKNLKKGDTVAVKFKTKINKSCKKKGCWMRLDLGDEQETLVRFKDYGFFVPLNAQGKEVIVNGKAYLDVVTVDELRHYAKDEGLSEEEINKITEEEITFAVESDGVLLVE